MWDIFSRCKEVFVALSHTFIQVSETTDVVQKRSDDESWMNGNNIPFGVMGLDEFPRLSFGESFPSSIDEMSVGITDTFLPCRRIVILFLKISQEKEWNTLYTFPGHTPFPICDIVAIVEVITMRLTDGAFNAELRILIVPFIAGKSKSLSLSCGLKWNGLAT